MKQFATITVIGRDKTGVIARVTAFLFEQHANIEALEKQVTRGQFSMTLQASWRPADCNAASLRAGLDTLARRLLSSLLIPKRKHEWTRQLCSGWPQTVEIPETVQTIKYTSFRCRCIKSMHCLYFASRI